MQKAALARALVTEPEILILDEPLSSVDQGFRPGMRSLIRSLHRDRGMTVVMATHDLADALALASHVAVISGGRIIQHGTVDEGLLKPASLFVASFSGIRNILHAVFDGMSARVGDLEIVLPEPASGSGYIALPPETVTISTTCPDSSQRNCFPVTVESVEPGVHVDIVMMAVGSSRIAAAITRESTGRLSLQPGTPAWISFKASSVRILT
jgi:molybdopterin-binding protein